jgi:acyl carrier protein
LEAAMLVNESDNLKTLLALIRDVKPSLGDSEIKLDDSLVETLGLDSLDIMQLARKIRRSVGPVFDPQRWAAGHQAHKFSVRFLLEAMAGAPAGEDIRRLPSDQQTLTA